MTKKDYIVIAAALRRARERATAGSQPVTVRYGISLLEQELRRVFVADNPRFDDDKFQQASGAFDKALQG